MLIDSAKIHIKAGNGGNGIVSFRREKYIPAGGPDGGDGGRGGSIIFEAEEGLTTLADFRYKRVYKAEPGKDGGPVNCSGRDAKDLIIKVPSGTIIKDLHTGKILADLVAHGDRLIAAKGGRGGWGNQHFATPTRQVPTFAKAGDEGDEKDISLELKMLADVGIVGYPNAGKSTILSVVSAAKPKIANYPFTTLEPVLGVVRVDEGISFVMADIPGLIEGAHKGAGLGHEFLKHIERTRLILHVVDISATDGRDPLTDFHKINEELEKYEPALAARPQIVAANKTDLPDSAENLAHFSNELEKLGYEVFPISAVTGEGVRPLLYRIASKLKEIPATILIKPEEERVVYTLKEEEPFTIRIEKAVQAGKAGETGKTKGAGKAGKADETGTTEKTGRTEKASIYIVEGNLPLKLVRSINTESYESMQYFQRSLKKMGVADELKRMGISEGDTVRIDNVEFDYTE